MENFHFQIFVTLANLKNKKMKRILLFNTLLFCCLLVSSQDLNKVVFDDAANQDILYGKCTPDAFRVSPFDEWYAPEYDSYSPNKEVVGELATLIDGIQIKIVLGTWCSDSQREVPRFIKLMEATNISVDNIEIICVNRGKTAIESGVDKGYIDFVPTFIVTRNGQEIGRIVEEPIETLELDLLSFLKK